MRKSPRNNRACKYDAYTNILKRSQLFSPPLLDVLSIFVQQKSKEFGGRKGQPFPQGAVHKGTYDG